ncbi:hypothetical protein [Halalkalicoccus jeotgali]|uniref:Uncharacterized protein n=1 Tax=Halalkalicoccus jeotgali (strain DSM 18796 / CECT 7217 / JCM 14584 / KCTC 4019 / B3) TaxID=795797 RepID=D8JC47_HALJB|nr:hypothetical protein [Halalkalicoccus jeotgali]ADJ16954.1 hypothetical protein HacjB3_18058 [Halalkalicoccus jeotgali B3]ADJ16985.1 hypothetical protein HacjB3_18213 [Halalkalicoccus jeotgali B3]ELY38609.1 hypothetical protein C497_06704 [Halalkalicoccus jeotgali B3]
MSSNTSERLAQTVDLVGKDLEDLTVAEFAKALEAAGFVRAGEGEGDESVEAAARRVVMQDTDAAQDTLAKYGTGVDDNGLKTTGEMTAESRRRQAEIAATEAESRSGDPLEAFGTGVDNNGLEELTANEIPAELDADTASDAHPYQHGPADASEDDPNPLVEEYGTGVQGDHSRADEERTKLAKAIARELSKRE